MRLRTDLPLLCLPLMSAGVPVGVLPDATAFLSHVAVYPLGVLLLLISVDSLAGDYS